MNAKMRIFSDLFKRRGARVNVGFLICMGFIVVYYRKTWPDEQNGIIQPSTVPTETHIIISSYLKGGSSLVGEVLGRRDDTFYSFEPLFVKSMWNYYKNNSTVCKILEKECVEVNSGSVQTALDMVASNYNCKTSVMVEKFYHPRWDNGGPPWRLYHQCIDEHKDAIFCNKILNTSCARATNSVVKVNRLSVRLLGQLLKKNPQLKVLHIFRDPRGIITSRMKMAWYPAISSSDILRTNAEGLCQRLEDDIEQGTKLSQFYPNRFKMILFEDFQADIDNALRRVLRFFNLQYTSQDRANVDAVMTSVEAQKYASDKGLAEHAADTEGASVASVNPFRWRETVDWETLRVIDDVCSGLYKKLGYNEYENEAQLRDHASWPGFGGGGIPPL